MTKIKKGQTITMYFSMAGRVSKEDVTVRSVRKDGTITIEDEWHSDESGKEEYGRFDLKTGKCLNDNTSFGASRYIDPYDDY